MDYLDPQKQFRHRIILFVGYIFVAVAITIATLILVYLSYGFGLGKNGSVIQNGLVFFSSQPSSSNIYLNGKLNSAQTNTRLVVPANIYKTQIQRSGYRTWQRTLEVSGGQVLHVDYPLLVPTTLKTTNYQTYAASPSLVTQSLDRRWLLVQAPGTIDTFEQYDLKSKTKVLTSFTLPSTLLTKSTGAESLTVVAWADDNQHVLLKHLYSDGKTEYVLVDRASPDQSQNLNTVLGSSLDDLTLQNHKYNQYYLYTASTQILQSVSLASPSPTVLLDHVLTYKTYGDNSFLYVTDSDAPTGKVFVKHTVGSQTFTLRTFSTGSTYLLDLAKYSGTEYAVMGASSENKVYVYKDPVGQLKSLPKHAIVPQQVLHVVSPDYVSFSPSGQFVVAEHLNQFGVYDIENSVGYNYSLTMPIDAPQTHVTWMDGNRFTLVSAGKAALFDYDGTNVQSLVAASPAFTPFYGPDYKYFYTMSSSGPAMQFGQSSLLIPADQ